MKKRKLLGIPVMVALVFGMMVVGCGGGSGSGGRDINAFDLMNLNTGAPTPNALSTGGLTPEQFTEIRNSTGGGFQGWFIDDGELIMVWSGRSRFQFESAAGVLRDFFDGTPPRFDDEDGVWYSFGAGFDIVFFPTRFVYDGIYTPAGTLFLHLWDYRD